MSLVRIRRKGGFLSLIEFCTMHKTSGRVFGLIGVVINRNAMYRIFIEKEGAERAECYLWLSLKNKVFH